MPARKRRKLSAEQQEKRFLAAAGEAEAMGEKEFLRAFKKMVRKAHSGAQKKASR